MPRHVKLSYTQLEHNRAGTTNTGTLIPMFILNNCQLFLLSKIVNQMYLCILIIGKRVDAVLVFFLFISGLSGLHCEYIFNSFKLKYLGCLNDTSMSLCNPVTSSHSAKTKRNDIPVNNSLLSKQILQIWRHLVVKFYNNDVPRSYEAFTLNTIMAKIN